MNPYIIQVIVLLVCYVILYFIVDGIFSHNKERERIRKVAGWIFCAGEIVGFALGAFLANK